MKHTAASLLHGIGRTTRLSHGIGSMVRNQMINNALSLLLFCTVNVLFAVKYTSRIDPGYALVLCGAYVCFCVALILCTVRLPEDLFRRRYAFLIAGAFVLFFLAALWFIRVDTIMNDRWSVIRAFFDDLIQGKYPYLAKSNQDNPPGPFPFYFVLTFPFYLINEIGLSTLTVFIAYFFLLNKQSAENRTLLFQTVLLVTSPAIVYEIVVRSTIFFNMGLIVLYVYWLEKRVLSGERKRVVVPGLVGGFLLSTRAIAAIPVVCYLSYSLLRRKDVSTYVKIGALMAAGFCLTFAPLVCWGWRSFLQNNPIFLQSSFSPLPVTVAFVAISFAGGLFLKSFDGYLRFCGIMLFLIVAISTACYAASVGWKRGFYDSKFDISYFTFCVPFLIASFKGFSGRHAASGS